MKAEDLTLGDIVEIKFGDRYIYVTNSLEQCLKALQNGVQYTSGSIEQYFRNRSLKQNIKVPS